jgi:hypothetical protein
MKCLECGIEFNPERATAKYCSPNCKTIYNRKLSVTPSDGKISVTHEKELSVTFRFKTAYKPLNDVQDDVAKDRDKVREAKYWYDIPLGAIPIIQKDWPKMPEFMNCRQYFLWWKNNFDVIEGSPVILDPYPKRDNPIYYNAGEGSRRWGS